MNDKLLLTCRRLFLRGFAVQVHIGIHDFELHAAQRIVLDVDLYVSMQGTSPKDDRIDEVVDYDFILAVVHARIAQCHINPHHTLFPTLIHLCSLPRQTKSSARLSARLY